MSTELSKIPELFMNEFSESPFRLLQNIFSDRNKYWRPRVDLKNTDKEYILTADLPGCDKKDIHIYLKDNILSIKGEHTEEEKEEKGDYYYQERSCGYFERSIYLPENTVDQKKINAKFENGVLTVKIEKTAESKKQLSEITIH
jgi:HSP20 family protein